MKFLVQHHRLFTGLGCALLGLSLLSLVAGCAAPTWITDISNLLPIVLSAFAGLSSVVLGYLGAGTLASTITTWITEIQNGIADIQEMVKQYEAAPNPTLLSNIEALLADVSANIQQDFSNLGIPAALLAIIASVASIALETLQSISSVIPALAAKAGDKFTVTTPKTKAELKAALQAVFSAPTGDAKLDSLLAKVKL